MLLKAICRFKAMPMKTLMAILTELEQIFLKLYGKD